MSKIIRFVVDVVVPDGTDPRVLTKKKVSEQVAKYAQAVALPGVKVKPEQSEKRANVHTHERGCGICESHSPYKTADELPVV